MAELIEVFETTSRLKRLRSTMSTIKQEILAHHTFTFPSLYPGAGSSQQPYIRFSIFIRKRPDISDEKFHEWWKTVHADLALSVAGFGGHCIRYVQLHQTAEQKKELEKHGLKPLPFDGVAELYVKSLQDWVDFQNSPVFAKKLNGKRYSTASLTDHVDFLLNSVGDGEKFMDDTFNVMMGYDNLIYGSKIAIGGGDDGVLPSDGNLTPAEE
jgi:hypothetical protein